MIIQVCCWKTCKANFSEYITKRIKWDIERLNLKDIKIEETMCMGMCSRWPNVRIDWEIINYAEPAKISDRVVNWPKKKKKKFNKK
jgi:NADH:ubiquinone oxidoreductase subunit E